MIDVKLKVNVKKTKIVIFSRGRHVDENIDLTYSRNIIEIVSNFNYLDLVFSSNGNFYDAIKTLSGKATRSMSELLYITKNKDIPVKIMIDLFDSFVGSILYYSSEVWGFITSELVERIHRKFLKKILNVKSSTSNSAIYGELGRFPLHINMKVRIIKYFVKLFSEKNSNCILQTVLTEMNYINNPNFWTFKVKDLLQRTGFYDVWLFPASVYTKAFLPMFRNRLRDIYICEWFLDIGNRFSLLIFRNLKDTFTYSIYLNKMKIRKYRNAVVKLRISAHQLLIETGRHRNIPRNERICELCDKNELEDEFHFLLVCPAYKELRQKYFKKYYYNKPNMIKLIELLNSEKLKF